MPLTTAAAAATGLARTLSPDAAGRAVWVRIGTLIVGSGGTVLRDAHLVYDARAIRYAGAADRPPPADLLPGGVTAPDATLPGWTVLPGLIEAHAHCFLEGAPVETGVREAFLKLPGDEMLARARARRERLFRMGVMTVRDAGDRHGVGLALQADHAASPEPPYLDSPGAAIFHKGRYGSFMGLPVEDDGTPEACVEGRVRAGAKRIKLLATGIINFQKGAVTAPPQMSTEEVGAFVVAARAHGRQAFAHASGTDGVGNSIDGGVTTVEHGFFITRDQLAKMRDRGIGWVPTFAPVQMQIDHAAVMGWSDEIVSGLKRIVDGHAASLRQAREMGVTVLAGSDAGSSGVAHGLGLVNEMELMERAGWPTLATLESATGTSARILDFPEPVGRIAPGYRPRMIFTQAVPLAGVRGLREPRIAAWDGRAVAAGVEPAAGL